MKILIIRHGDPDYTIDSLTKKGWREAEYLSERLAKIDIDAFYCSPLGRAKDTAKPTMEKKNASYTVLDWLREFSGNIISPYTNKKRIPWDLAPSLWTDEPKFYDREKWLDVPLMQTGNVSEIFEETKKGVDELLLKYGVKKCGMHFIEEKREKEPTIALFCHCGMGIAIISYLTGIPTVVAWHNLFMPTSSVSTIITETDKNGISHFKCMQIGDTSHLYASGEEVSLSGLYPNFEK